jgi:hypothetical protein
MLTGNGLKYPLDELKEIVKKHLYIEDDSVIDVMVAVHLANQFQTDPLWMLFVAPPSTAKTELLRAFEGHPRAYFLSSLTPSTLISGQKPTKGNPQPSLLPKLNDKTLVLKDFTTILSMRSEQQQEILAQFREVYDGSFCKVFGTGVSIDWKGHVGFMGAVTPVYDKHYAVIGSMGDRFLLYRSKASDEYSMGLRAIRNVGKEDEMRKEIREAVHLFIDQFDTEKIRFDQISEDVESLVVSLACFCAYARCVVERDYRTQHIQYQPEPEGPARLAKQFMQLGMALALVRGKKGVDETIYETLKKIGRDLITKHRLKIITTLWERKVIEFLSEWMKTKEIANATGMPATTAKVILEDLMSVGLLNQALDGEGETAAWKWQLSQKGGELIGASEIFEVPQ